MALNLHAIFPLLDIVTNCDSLQVFPLKFCPIFFSQAPFRLHPVWICVSFPPRSRISSSHAFWNYWSFSNPDCCLVPGSPRKWSVFRFSRTLQTSPRRISSKWVCPLLPRLSPKLQMSKTRLRKFLPDWKNLKNLCLINSSVPDRISHSRSLDRYKPNGKPNQNPKRNHIHHFDFFLVDSDFVTFS